MAFADLVVEDGGPIRTVNIKRPQLRNVIDAAEHRKERCSHFVLLMPTGAKG